MLCLCGGGKLIIVWVLCPYNLYELFQVCTLFFLCCLWETKVFLERHTLCPCIQENAQKLGQIADEDKLWRGRSLSKWYISTYFTSWLSYCWLLSWKAQPTGEWYGVPPAISPIVLPGSLVLGPVALDCLFLFFSRGKLFSLMIRQVEK